jgi:2'-5' RNA ligase
MQDTRNRIECSNVSSPAPLRVFVGLKVAPDIANELAGLARRLEGPSVRLITASDIHLTLVPPWNEIAITDAIDKLRTVAGCFASFLLRFEHVGYGPQPRRPRLLWAGCAASDELIGLQAALMRTYARMDERPFRPHVTLARIRGHGSAIARDHPIDLELSLIQRVATVELFQSPPSGAQGYRVLASPHLGETAQPVSMTLNTSVD